MNNDWFSGPFQAQAVQQPTQKQKPQEKKKQGGLVGFARGVVSSVADPFIQTGRALKYVPQAIGREIQNKPIDDIQKKAFGTTDTGGIAKKIIGNTAQVGLAVAAPGATAIKEGIAIGAGTGAASALSQKDSTAEDVLTGGLLGGATGGALGVGGGILSKIANSGKKLGPNLEEKGARLMGTQANLTRSEGRKIGAVPSDVLKAVHKRTGISNLDEASKIAQNVTGENGAYSELVRNAIGNSPGIDIGDMRKVTEDLLVNKAPLVSNSQRKNIIEQVKNSVTGAYGGSEGSLSTLANPLDAFSVAKNFRGQAADIRKGATVSAADKQLATVYDEVGRSIEDRLYKAPGVNEGIKSAAPDRATDLRFLAHNAASPTEAKAYEKLAKELDELGKTGDIKKARSLQQDFVKLNQIDEATARANSGAGAQLGGQMQGFGKLVQRPTNLAAVPLDAATPKVGGILANLGRNISYGTSLPSVPGGRVIGGLASRVLRQGATAQAGASAVPGQEPTTSPESDQLSSLTNEQPFDYTSAITEPPKTYNPYDPENIQDSINQIVGQGGKSKDIKDFLDIAQSMSKLQSDSEGKKLSATQQKAEQQAQNALSALNQIKGSFEAAGGGQGKIGGTITNIGAKLGINSNAATYNDTGTALAAQIYKALGNTGTMSDADQALVSKLIPRTTDNATTANQKIQQLQDLLDQAQQTAVQ